MSSSIFYACLPGLERVLAQELAAFKPRVLSGGCEVRREPSVAPACASHKLVRLDSPFESRFFDELETGFARLEVAKVLKGKTVGLSVSSSKSRLYHVGAIADRLCKLFPFVKSGGGGGVDAKLHVRLFRDKCQVSLEEGEPLHKRGYRLETGKAPLREDISSALVQVAKMDENCSMLLDPFCGSGTIVIEAALLLKRAKRRARLIGGDRDEGAIEMARRNAERAGVADMCEFLCQSFSESLKIASKETVVVVTHPPFGLRTKADRGHLSNLYSGFLERLKDLTQLKDCVILVNDLQLIRSCRVEERFRTRSGGIPVAAVSIEKWSESRKD